MLLKIPNVLSLTVKSLHQSAPYVILLVSHWQRALTLSPSMLIILIVLCLNDFIKLVRSISSRVHSVIDDRATNINPFTRKYAVKSSPHNIREVMNKSSFFTSLKLNGIDKLVPYFQLSTFDGDSSVPLLRQGDDQNFVGVIIEGCLDVRSVTNVTEKPLYSLGKDDTIGETLLSMSREGRQPHNIYVRKPGRVLTIALTDLEELSLNAPLLYNKLIELFMSQAVRRSIKEPNYQPINKERVKKRFVALIAHDAKKMLLEEFVVKHKNVLEKYNLTGTATTSAMLLEKANLKTSYKVPSGPLGGDLSIGALIANDCIDAVIFFKDSLSMQCHYADIEAFCEICDVYNVPLATNIYTAELIMKYLEDLSNSRNTINRIHNTESTTELTGIESRPAVRRLSSIFRLSSKPEEIRRFLSETSISSDEVSSPSPPSPSIQYQGHEGNVALDEITPAKVTMDVEELTETFKEIGVMDGFKTNEIECISELIEVKDLKRGMVLFQADENKDFLLVVLKGRIEIVVEDVADDSSEYERVVGSVGKGEVYGLSNLILNQVRSSWGVSAIATRATRIALLKRNDVQELHRRNEKVYDLIHSWKDKMMLKMYKNDNFSLDLDSKFFILTCDDTNAAIYSMKNLITSGMDFFKKHRRDLIVPSDISDDLQSLTQLKFTHNVLAPIFGGAMELGDIVCRSRVKAAIVFRDGTLSEKRFEALLRVIDLYAVPVATNPATAEILIRYFNES